MVSPQMERFHDLLRAYLASSVGPDGQMLTLDQIRINIASVQALATEPEGVTYQDVDAGGVRAIWTIPADGADDRVILFVHGGGYVMGEPEHYNKFCGHLANVVGCRVLNLGYRLAPEHPHPAAVNDSVAAYRWLLAEGFEPNHIAVSGDSAGGGLAITTLLAIRDHGLPQPAASVPMSPWVDMEGLSDSMRNGTDDVVISYEGMLLMAQLFVGDGDHRDPLVAPIYADFTGIAPMYLQVGGHERLRDETLQVAEKARRDGAQAHVDVFPELQHIFQVAVGTAPESDDAMRRIAAFLRPLFGLEPGSTELVESSRSAGHGATA